MNPEPFQPVEPNPDLSIHPAPLRADVAVVCFWRDALVARRDWLDVAVVGPLRTQRGLVTLVRNLLANPQIHYLIPQGPDLNGLRPALDDLVGQVIGDLDLTEEQQQSIRRVQVVDTPGVPIMEPRGPAFCVEAPPVPLLTVFPHGHPGARVIGVTVDDVWPRALEQAVLFGRQMETSYGGTREYLGLTSVVTDPLSGTFSEADHAYKRQLVGSDPPTGRAYSYGSRMTSPTPQIANLIAGLARSPNGRAHYVTPWDPAEDSGKESGRPCLVGIWFRRVEDQIHTFATFRSHDLYAGYPMNLRGISLAVADLAHYLNLRVGPVTIHSLSAHVYDRDLADATRVIAESPPPLIDWDVRSNWHVTRVVTPTGGQIQAVALDPVKDTVLATFTAPTAGSLRVQILKSGLVTSIGAAMWLGAEIAKFDRSSA